MFADWMKLLPFWLVVKLAKKKVGKYEINGSIAYSVFKDVCICIRDDNKLDPRGIWNEFDKTK